MSRCALTQPPPRAACAEESKSKKAERRSTNLPQSLSFCHHPTDCQCELSLAVLLTYCGLKLLTYSGQGPWARRCTTSSRAPTSSREHAVATSRVNNLRSTSLKFRLLAVQRFQVFSSAVLLRRRKRRVWLPVVVRHTVPPSLLSFPVGENSKPEGGVQVALTLGAAGTFCAYCREPLPMKEASIDGGGTHRYFPAAT